MVAIGVVSTGSYLPERVVTNAELAPRVGVEPGWIEQKTHIRTRRYAAAHEATSDLAATAAKNALDAGGLAPTDIDYIVLSTSTPDSPQPPTASLVARRLGADKAACFDLNAVCGGFVYALAVARGLLLAHQGARALVVAADLYSRFLDFDDRATTVLLGDGAGAAVLGPTAPGHGVLHVDLRTRGDRSDLIWIEAGGSRLPSSHGTVDAGGHYFRMRGRDVRDFVLDEVPRTLDATLLAAGVDRRQLDHFIPHQANGAMLDELVARAHLTDVATHRTVDRYGNTGSATVAVTLDEANRSGALKHGDLVLLSGFGGGMSIGHCLLRWAAGSVPLAGQSRR